MQGLMQHGALTVDKILDHAARCRKFSNRHCIQGLTPYYATEPI